VWYSSSGFNSSTLALIIQPITEVIFFCGTICWLRLRATALTPKLPAVARNKTSI
jgi:hypothetical protein